MRRIDAHTVHLDLDEIEVHDAYERLRDGEGLTRAEAVAALDEAGSFIGRDTLRAYLLA